MNIKNTKFEINEIVEVEADALRSLFLKAIEQGQMHNLSLEYALAYPLAAIKKLEQDINGRCRYLLDFLDVQVDYILFEEKDLKATGHFVKPNKFKSYEIVRIVNPSKWHKENLKYLNGFIGGMGINKHGIYGYDVFLFNKQEVYCFEEHELESTGEFAKKEDFYSGQSIKVIVHPDGKGELKE